MEENKLIYQETSTLKTNDYTPKNINFYISDGNIELLRISKIDDEYKIIFNKEQLPQYTSDDFAKNFIDTVERYIIKK